RGQEVCQDKRELLHGAIGVAASRRTIERDVIVSAKPHQPHVTSVPLLPGVELTAKEEDALPERAASTRRATALDLDHRRRQLDDTGIEVDGASRGQMVRAPSAVHQRPAHDPTW